MLFQRLNDLGFDIEGLHHAPAILSVDMPEASDEIEAILGELRIPIEELVAGGGGEAPVTQRLRRSFAENGWRKHNFEITKIVDGNPTESTSHEIDHVKKFGPYTFALEIEWNNKDPFYDRDLENFKRLHAEGAISIGCIVTRGQSLHEGLRDMMEAFAQGRNIQSVEDLEPFEYAPTRRQRELIAKKEATRGFARGWAEHFVSDKFGEATTHWRKLEDRVRRGVGNPCPLVLIGLPKEIVDL